MLRIECPFCGLRNHHEFTYLEDGSITMPDITMPGSGNMQEKAWYEAVFLRENPRGPHIEDWHHTQGCRMVLRVKRDTVTQKSPLLCQLIRNIEKCWHPKTSLSANWPGNWQGRG